MQKSFEIDLMNNTTVFINLGIIGPEAPPYIYDLYK